MPLLVIQGTDDQYSPVDQVNSIVSKSLGSAQLEMIENCCHVPHLEAEPIILELMSDFVAQVK